MKKRFYKQTAIITALLFLCGCASVQEDTSLDIVASFYPIYSITSALTKNAQDISLINMAQPQTGCLHDYQLTPGNMKTLDLGDILVINGGGMESFIDNASENFKSLKILNSSDGILEEHHSHTSPHEGHNHETNMHIWMSFHQVLLQAKNIKDVLCESDIKNADVYEQNLMEFNESVHSLEEFSKTINSNGVKIAIFHEALEFLETEMGMEIEISMDFDENSMPSPKSLASAIDLINDKNIKYLFVADDQGKAFADIIAQETNAVVVTIDPILNGDFSENDYINKMYSNLHIIKEALCNE